MAEIRIPRWLITKITLSGGCRLDKRPKLVAPPVVSPYDRYRAYWPGGVTAGKATPMVEASVKGFKPITSGVTADVGFENWEYRFWAVDLNIGQTAIMAQTCRGCSAVYYTKKGRQTHMNAIKCTVKLTQAYLLLQRDKKCVICNKQTRRQVWGVPLCDGACQKVWCEEIEKPESLEAALQLVEANFEAAKHRAV